MKRQSDKQTFSMNFGAKKWAALYVRLSRDDDSEGDSNSIAHQIEILKKYAKDHNIIQYKIYKDDGYSGANFNRPGFQEMISDIESGHFTIPFHYFEHKPSAPSIYTRCTILLFRSPG